MSLRMGLFWLWLALTLLWVGAYGALFSVDWLQGYGKGHIGVAIFLTLVPPVLWGVVLATIGWAVKGFSRW